MEKYSPIFNVKNDDQMRELIEFVAKAKKRTSRENPDKRFHCSKTESWPDNDRKIDFADGPWHYKDYRDGGDPFKRTVEVYYNHKLAFKMICVGGLLGEATYQHKDEVYTCLRSALRNFDPQNPWRGPAKFDDKNGFHYCSEIIERKNGNFLIKEEIQEPYGATMYRAECKCSFV